MAIRARSTRGGLGDKPGHVALRAMHFLNDFVGPWLGPKASMENMAPHRIAPIGIFQIMALTVCQAMGVREHG